mmetsp:Transcript_388/g.960  ORF Transcript_388/g.960 Transcript_388/m.960 type:complete len:221 (+) Transcript_388:199-861(+)
MVRAEPMECAARAPTPIAANLPTSPCEARTCGAAKLAPATRMHAALSRKASTIRAALCVPNRTGMVRTFASASSSTSVMSITISRATTHRNRKMGGSLATAAQLPAVAARLPATAAAEMTKATETFLIAVAGFSRGVYTTVMSAEAATTCLSGGGSRNAMAVKHARYMTKLRKRAFSGETFPLGSGPSWSTPAAKSKYELSRQLASATSELSAMTTRSVG